MESQPGRALREKERLCLQSENEVLVHVDRVDDENLRASDHQERNADKASFTTFQAKYRKWFDENEIDREKNRIDREAWALEKKNKIFSDAAEYVFRYNSTLVEEKKSNSSQLDSDSSIFTYQDIGMSNNPNEPLRLLKAKAVTLKQEIPLEQDRLSEEDLRLSKELSIINLEADELKAASKFILDELKRWQDEDAEYEIERAYIEKERKLRRNKESIIETNLSARENSMLKLEQRFDRRTCLQNQFIALLQERFSIQNDRKGETKKLAKQFECEYKDNWEKYPARKHINDHYKYNVCK